MTDGYVDMSVNSGMWAIFYGRPCEMTDGYVELSVNSGM